MSDVIKSIIVALIVCSVLAAGTAFALMPANHGTHSPSTVWSDTKGTVSGKIVTSLDRQKGVEGAYVALVNSANPGEEYYNTTSDANGNFRFTNVSATYSSVLSKGPDGTGGSYQAGMNAYTVYANLSSAGEGLSGSFGVDTNHTNSVGNNIVIFAGVPSAAAPTPTPQPTANAPTPAPATATPPPPTATPRPAGLIPAGLPLVVAVLAVVAIAAAAAYFLLRRKKGRGPGRGRRSI